MNKKETLRRVQIFLGIFLAVSICFIIFNAICDISTKPNADFFEDTITQGDYVSGTCTLSTGCFFEVKHLIRGIIPIHTEHYYMAFNRNGTEYIVVRAKKDWNKKMMHEGADFDVEGRVRTLPAGGSRAVQSALSNLNKEKLSVTYMYVDTLAKSNGIMTVIASLIIIIGALLVYFIDIKKRPAPNDKKRKAAGIAGAALLIVGCMLLEYSLCQ